MDLRSTLLSIGLAALGLAGCVGTDFIADPLPEQTPARLEINQEIAALEVGQTATLTASYFDESGSEQADVQITWSSSNPAIATVDADGTVRGLQSGQIRVVAAVGDLESEPIIVGIAADPDQLVMVRATPTQGQLAVGETLELSVRGSNSQGGTLTGNTYTWASSDPEVVAVDADGVATGLAPGRALLTAASEGITSNQVEIQVVGDGRTGSFVPKPGTRYRVTGTAQLKMDDSGALVLEFGPDFSVSAGPRLGIYLSTTNSVGPGSVDLGEIQSFTGSQTYQLPDSVELTSFDWVVIHCVPFNITFGFAQFE